MLNKPWQVTLIILFGLSVVGTAIDLLVNGSRDIVVLFAVPLLSSGILLQLDIILGGQRRRKAKEGRDR